MSKIAANALHSMPTKLVLEQESAWPIGERAQERWVSERIYETQGMKTTLY